MKESEKFRKVETFKDYFEDFFTLQSENVKDKIIWTLELIEDYETIPSKFFKNVDGKLYEIRIRLRSNIFRIFSFFDSGKLIILANGFHKKSNKLPKSEIKKALKIMAQYFEEKINQL